MSESWMEARFFGQPVSAMQQMLRTVHFQDERVPAVIPTGVFDEETEQGLKAFQRANGLPQTGEADYETWTKLAEAFCCADRELSAARPLRAAFQRETKIQPGGRNPHLYLFQAALCALSEVLDVPPLMPTGVQDQASEAATRWLQEKADLPADGTVNKQTWNALCCLYPAMMGDGSGAY